MCIVKFSYHFSLIEQNADMDATKVHAQTVERKLMKELEAEVQTNGELRKKIKELQTDLDVLNGHIREYEQQMTELDKENDSLRAKLDERNEMIAMIEDEVKNVKETFAQSQQQYTVDMQQQLAQKDGEINNLKREIEVPTFSLDVLFRIELKGFVREIKRQRKTISGTGLSIH
jgi:uncharacterized coiled-coil DUF342 family protein